MSTKREPDVLRRAVSTALVWLAIAVPLLASQTSADVPGSVVVLLQRDRVRIPAGTRLAGLLRSRGAAPTPGRLLDVEGAVLDPEADPGTVLLNGRPASGATRLRPGDRVTVLDGSDSVEPTRRTVQRLPGRRPANPQFTLAAAPMDRVTVRGGISDKVLSIDYRSRSALRRPRQVALTFDDGPWPRSTLRILRILRRMRVEATFFMVGALVRRSPEIVRAVHRAGMAIGNHSDRHPYSPAFSHLPTWRRLHEIRAGRRALAELGIRTSLFRPPGGSFNRRILREAAAFGQRVVLWDVDGRDWQTGLRPRELARRVLAAVRPGSIVVLHDGGGDRRATIAALPAIVRGIRRMGLELVAIRDAGDWSLGAGDPPSA